MHSLLMLIPKGFGVFFCHIYLEKVPFFCHIYYCFYYQYIVICYVYSIPTILHFKTYPRLDLIKFGCALYSLELDRVELFHGTCKKLYVGTLCLDWFLSLLVGILSRALPLAFRHLFLRFFLK